MSRGRNASDEVFAILDVQVTGLVFLVGHDLPSEKGRIKISGALGVGRAQIGPT